MKSFHIFAVSKINSGQNAAGEQPAIFVPTLFGNQNFDCAVSGTSNGPGALLLRLRQHVAQFLMSIKLTVMNQTIRLGQVVQPSVLSSVERIVKNFETWWNSISVTFTRLCATDEGEVFSHGEVVKAHLYAAVVILIGIGGAL